jgi:hypothetical protein
MFNIHKDRGIGCFDFFKCGQINKVMGAKKHKVKSMFLDNNWSWRKYKSFNTNHRIAIIGMAMI